MDPTVPTVLALGEVMVRLSVPAAGRLEFARSLEVDVGGGEYNVVYALARLGHRSGFISRLPDHPLSRLVLNHARAAGLDPDSSAWSRTTVLGARIDWGSILPRWEPV